MKNYYVANRVSSVLVSLIIILALFIFPTNTVRAQAPDPGYSYLNSWGGDGRQLLGVNDVAVGPDGRVYIVNSTFNRITIVDPVTKFYTEFGEYGSENGKFYRPFSVVVSDLGIVYVADRWNNRLQMFDADGNFIKVFSQFDTMLDQPFALALDSQQNLLMLDYSRDLYSGENQNKLIKYSPEGNKIAEFMFPAENPFSLNFTFSTDIAIDSQDNIIVTNFNDVDNNFPALIKISSDFDTFSGIEVKGESSVPYELNGIAIDSQDRLYLTSSDNQLLLLNELGQIPSEIGQFGTGPQEFSFPAGLTIDGSGRILVSDYMNNRLQILSPEGEFVDVIGSAEAQNGFFYCPSTVDYYKGEIFVGDSANYRIEVFNNDGSYLRTIDSSSIIPLEEGFQIEPKTVNLDPFGNMFIMYLSNNGFRLSKIDENLFELAFVPVSNDLFAFGNSFGIDSEGNIYIPDPQNKTVLAFDNDLVQLQGWQNPVLPVAAHRVDIDSQGNVLVDQSENYPIEAFTLLRLDKTGKVLSINGELDLSFTFNNNLLIPLGFDTDSLGNHYTYFSGGTLVRKYDVNFNLIAEFGQLNSSGPWARMARYNDIVVVEDGRIYLPSYEDNAVQVFAPNSHALDSPTGLIQNGDFTKSSNTTQATKLNSLSTASPQAGTSDFTGLSSWTVGGLLGVSRSTETSTSEGYSMRLGTDSIENPGLTDAWAYQTFTIPADTIHNQLSFKYRVSTNDVIANSDFSVLIYDGNGLEKLEELVHAGQPNANGLPAAGTDLGWQAVSVNLDAYRGRSVRLLFQARNLRMDAQGIWAFVEEVQLYNKHGLYLPLITR